MKYCFLFLFWFSGLLRMDAQNPWIANDDVTKEKWVIHDDSTLKTYYLENQYHIEVKRQEPYYITKKIKLDESHNFKIEVTFEVVSIISDDNRYGLFFGANNDATEGYYLILSANGEYRIARQTAGAVITDLATNFDGPAFAKGVIRKGHGKPNKLTVTRRGDYWGFYINDVSILQSKTYPFAGDRIAFFVPGKTHLVVNSFKVYDWTLAATLPLYEREPETTVRFFDNFYDNKSGWLTNSTKNVNFDLNNYYSIENKTDEAYAVWHYVEEAGRYSNWAVEMELWHESGTHEWGYGLAFGLKDVDNRFALMIADGGFKVSRIENGELTTLHDWADTSVIHKGNYRSNLLEIRCIQKQWKFYVNHHLLCTLPAQPFFGKNFGLYIEDKQKIRITHIQFADLFFREN